MFVNHPNTHRVIVCISWPEKFESGKGLTIYLVSLVFLTKDSADSDITPRYIHITRPKFDFRDKFFKTTAEVCC